MMEVRKSGILRTIPFMLIVIVFCTSVYGTVIHVNNNGQADFDNIQAGIDAAVDGDIVLVAPGEYVITEPITFRGKAITVISEAGPDETTIRMGTPADTNRGSVIIFENGETNESVLDGFTITGGRGSWIPSAGEWGGGGILFDVSSGTVKNCTIVQNNSKYGGGVCCLYQCSPRLADCTIMENSAVEIGGGVFVYFGSSPTLDNCMFTGNSANWGGGIYSRDSSVTMADCVVTGNAARDATGGVFWADSSVTITNCIILSNTAQRGSGAMECAGGHVTVTNCVIARNTVLQGNSGGGVYCTNQGSATVTNSIIWGNIAANGREIWLWRGATCSIAYSDVAGGQAAAHVESGSTLNWGAGNIDTDPLFVDPNNDDFHLKSQAGRWDPNSQSWIQDDVTSPCIDTGDPNSDCNAELWPHGQRVNMGVYGDTSKASRSLSDAGNIADLNRDGIVDSNDVCIMVDNWHTNDPLCDISPTPFGDGIVDVQDLITLAEHLFEEVPPTESVE